MNWRKKLLNIIMRIGLLYGILLRYFFFAKEQARISRRQKKVKQTNKQKKQLAGLVERLEDGIGSSDSEEDVPIVEPKMEEFCLLWGP